jgi:hypothetical protein
MFMSVLRAGCMFPRTHARTNSFFLSVNELVVLWSDNVKMQAFNAERAAVVCCRILVTIRTNTQKIKPRLKQYLTVCLYRVAQKNVYTLYSSISLE